MSLLGRSRHMRMEVDRYLPKTIVHELAMLFLWRITCEKRIGWRFFDSPGWFHDGMEESTYRSSGPRCVLLMRRLQMSRSGEDATRERPPTPLLDLMNGGARYLYGPLVLEYMHERFCPAKLRALLAPS